MIGHPTYTTWGYVRMDVEPLLAFILVDLFILVTAVVRWRRHPQASVLATTGATCTALDVGRPRIPVFPS